MVELRRRSCFSRSNLGRGRLALEGRLGVKRVLGLTFNEFNQGFECPIAIIVQEIARACRFEFDSRETRDVE